MKKPKNKKHVFSVNRHNQLILKDQQLPKPHIIKGKFVIGPYNRLLFLVNESRSWKRRYRLPDTITFKGTWNVNNNHDLVFSFNKNESRLKVKRITFRAQLLEYRGDSLIFTIRTKESRAVSKITLFKVEGKLTLDKHNRLTFIVKKPKRPNALVLSGSWKLNQNQEIVYEYQKLKTKAKRKIVLKGFWDIPSRNRLRYYLEGSTKNFLDFKVSVESPTLYPSRKTIKYRLQVGAGKRRKKKVIMLRGEWKIKKDCALEFIMKGSARKVKKIEFRAQLLLKRNNKLFFTLSNQRNEPLGIKIVFDHNILNNSMLRLFLESKNFKRLTKIGFKKSFRF